MTTNRPYSSQFRLGHPAHSGSTGLLEVDPYAERAIKKVGKWFADNEWILPEAAARLQVIPNQGDWRARVALVILSQPFGKQRQPREAIRLDDLLKQQGHTALMQSTRREIEELSPSRNAQAILHNDDIFDFLFAYAYYELSFVDEKAIACWLIDPDPKDGGVGVVYRVVAVEAFKDHVKRERIQVGGVGPGSDFAKATRKEAKNTYAPFDAGSFTDYLADFIDDFAFRRKPLELIRAVDNKFGLKATEAEIDHLGNYFEASGVTLTKAKAEALVPAVLTTYRNSAMSSKLSAASIAGPIDFDVTYHTDTNASSSVNRSNVLCAAQLFYVMTLGDELGVFRATDLLITRYMGVGRVDVKSPQLMRDLQDYAFNDEFREIGSGRINQRTSEEERRMFYRQVFDMGETELIDGMTTNTDFASLWNALMVETVRYIEKVEQAENPAAFVSRSSLQQVMEDLQYNLSTYASGMAKVMTPIAYKEFDFLIERIWKTQEIIDQLAIHNTGSYLRAIERVLQDDDRRGSNITALLKKAQFGHQILKAVADFTPQMIADDAQVSGLVSMIEAFIIASEQADYEPAGERGAASQLVSPGGAPEMGMPVDEWSF